MLMKGVFLRRKENGLMDAKLHMINNFQIQQRGRLKVCMYD